MLLKEAGSSARVAESPFSLSDGRREKKADNNTSASTFDADIAPIARPANKLQHHMRDLDVFFFLPREMAVPRQLRRALGRRAGAEMKTRRTAEWHIQDTTLSAPHYPRRRTPPPPLARLRRHSHAFRQSWQLVPCHACEHTPISENPAVRNLRLHSPPTLSSKDTPQPCLRCSGAECSCTIDEICRTRPGPPFRGGDSHGPPDQHRRASTGDPLASARHRDIS